MSSDVIWISAIVVVLAGATAFGTMLRYRVRRRILKLEWPEEFQNWQTMCNYCKRYLRHNGWRVRACMSADADLLASKQPHHMVINVLIKRDYWDRIPDHFVTRSALAIVRRKLPVAVVTDFRLADDIVERCQRRQVYPVYFADLGKLQDAVPAIQQFRQLRPEFRIRREFRK